MSKIIDEYIDDVGRHLRHMPTRERKAVLDEMRLHLIDEAKRLRSGQASVSADEAALQATNAFGAPREIGVAYGAGGGVINRTTGERLLDVAILTSQAAGRGAKGVLKWTGITAAVLLGVGLIVFVSLLFAAGNVVDTFQNDIRESIPRPLYDYEGSWGQADANTEITTDSFQVGDNVKEFIIRFDIDPATGANGCARVTLTSPSGSVAYDSGTDCGAESRRLTLNDQGTWTLQYEYVAYSGTVEVEAHYFQKAPA